LAGPELRLVPEEGGGGGGARLAPRGPECPGARVVKLHSELEPGKSSHSALGWKSIALPPRALRLAYARSFLYWGGGELGLDIGGFFFSWGEAENDQDCAQIVSALILACRVATLGDLGGRTLFLEDLGVLGAALGV
jgi:hypothetical protein